MARPDTAPDDIDALRAALAAEQLARREAMVAQLKLLIARRKHDRFGTSSERGRKLLDQMELELEELEATASEDAGAVATNDGASVREFTRRKPVRAARRHICRASAWSFLARPRVPAVAASSPSWVRPSPRHWK
jgi:transposase